MTGESKEQKALQLIARLLDPEDLGLAVSAEVRDAAREVLGMPKVETSDGRQAI